MNIADSILFPGLSCRTWLTHHSGLADAELQLITEHSRRETLAPEVLHPASAQASAGSIR